ncbi:MAG: sigma-70 family RNA polymerase sigma factor [Ferruginibacter sp.]
MIFNRTNTDNIIDGCKKNNRIAQEQLYKSYYESMMNMCLRYTINEEDAKHILNNGFLRVFKIIHQFDQGKATLYTWIRTIVMNCCLDHLRSKQQLVVSNELHAIAEQAVEPDIHDKMNAEQILFLLKTLPAATQTVFNLYVVDGYSHKEIAEMLQVSEGTSKWHLSEARRIMKQKLLQKEKNLY